MPAPHPLPDPLVDLIASRFRVIGEPMRIKLLDRLRDGEASVQELAEVLGSSQQNVSKHLSVLHQADIVGRRKDGNYTRYFVIDPGVYELCEQVCGGLERKLAELGALLAPQADAATAPQEV